MRKLMVGLLMLVSLLAVTPLAVAQHAPGSLDPVGLIASGAVIPFLGEGLATGGMSFLELYTPVGGATVHMFLFDASCVRGGPSINVELSANDVALVRVDNIGSGAPTSGLITAADSDGTGFTLLPWVDPSFVAARTLWANSNGNFVRVIDPIALANIDEFIPPVLLPDGITVLENTGGWNPMRTAAAFFAPLEAGALHTTIYFVCPNTNIQRSAPTNGGALSPGNGFNIIFPRLQLAGSTTPLRIRVYDDDEHLLRDVTSSCNCLTIRPVTAIDLVYASAVSAPDGTYTEVEGGTQSAVPAVCSPTGAIEPLVTPNTPNSGNACPGVPLGCDFGATVCTGQIVQVTPSIPGAGPFSFVAYRAITVPGFDVFGRVPGSSRGNISGVSSANTLGR